MTDELATPEHDKLLSERDLQAALARVFEWMNEHRGGKARARVAICSLKPEHISEKVYCDSCEGSGKDITQLSQRQAQVVRHMRLLKEEQKPWQNDKKAEYEAALAELEMFVDELDKCNDCYGSGEATAYRTGDPVWKPEYDSPRELMLDMLGIDRAAFKKETAELFAQLREQAGERPAKGGKNVDAD